MSSVFVFKFSDDSKASRMRTPTQFFFLLTTSYRDCSFHKILSYWFPKLLQKRHMLKNAGAGSHHFRLPHPGYHEINSPVTIWKLKADKLHLTLHSSCLSSFEQDPLVIYALYNLLTASFLSKVHGCIAQKFRFLADKSFTSTHTPLPNKRLHIFPDTSLPS